MNIDHIGLYVNDLEKTKRFFETYFHATSNELYHNKTTGLKTYFLSFDNHTRLEIMHRPNLFKKALNELQIGYHHIAFKLGSEKRLMNLQKFYNLMVMRLFQSQGERVMVTMKQFLS